MAGLLDGVDLTKPCLVWPVLEKAYLEAVMTGGQVRVRFDKREVEFGPLKLPALLAEINRLKALCAASQGRRTRFAIRGRFRPDFG